MYFIASLTKPLRICFAKSKHPNNIISSQHKLNTIKIYKQTGAITIHCAA